MNFKANAKDISRFDFSALYTKLSHFDLVYWMISLNSHFRVIIKNTLISLEIELFGVINLNIHFFTKNSLEKAVQHLIKCCHFEVGNVTGISIDLAPFCAFCANIYISKHELDFMDKLIKEDIECYWFLKSNNWKVQIIPFKSIV